MNTVKCSCGLEFKNSKIWSDHFTDLAHSTSIKQEAENHKLIRSEVIKDVKTRQVPVYGM